jgi:peptidoglycan lytic transglycosylase
MRGMGASGGLSLFLRLLALSTACVALASCSGGLSGKIDPKYGVRTSARVIEPGQPVPKGGGVYRVGKPYIVAGREYVPQENVNYSATGLASWYGDDFHGRYTANGEIFDMNAISAAHPTLPLPSYVRVTNLANRRSIVVRVNDRGPYAGDRLIDVSVRTAKLLGFYGDGLAKVKVEYVGRAPLAGSDDRKLVATLREHERGKPVQVASSKAYAPLLFDNHPMSRLPARVQAPDGRPYSLGEEQPGRAAGPTTELAAATRPKPMENSTRAVLSAAPPQPSPVSAYAPVRYDSRNSFMSGRGLY